ncbi:MAG: AraC family transcriptional regulator, partial [Phycisphaerae bacterium]|nr:AraC family transcriptional regulator [Phycisphaerae bacterium]
KGHPKLTPSPKCHKSSLFAPQQPNLRNRCRSRLRLDDLLRVIYLQDTMRSDHANVSIQSVHRAGGQERPVRIAPQFFGMGIIEFKAGFDYALHRHKDHEVILVHEGEYRCTLNERELTFGPGEILLIAPGDRHRDFCDPPLRYFAFRFHFDGRGPGPTKLLAEGITPDHQHARVDLAIFWPLVEAIQRESDRGGLIAPLVQDALLEEFFWRMVRAFPAEAIHEEFLGFTASSAFPIRLLRLFQAHIAENLSVAQMARRLNMSQSALAHTCKAVLGAPPARLFLQCRMDFARRLLATTDLSVKQVARRVGFDDPYHFSRTFKKLTGRSPSESRR